MTCKISFFKSIRETLKHHVASVFATCLVFFIQFIVFFLNLQNLIQEKNDTTVIHASSDWAQEQLQAFTQPGYGYMVPVILVAILLAYDFFRYLHSKKQTDFYESLPINRKKWFLLRTASALLAFIVPYAFTIGLEILLLVIFGMGQSLLIQNLLWNLACMSVIFLITWLTALLAMIMTGNSVIALFAFGTFSVYMPIIIQYLISSYASVYFETYASATNELSSYLNYLSPIGSAILLTGNTYVDWTVTAHIKDFGIILGIIILLGLLVYYLFCKRPSEAAARAMTFEKASSVIRIMLAVPLTLYLGLYLGLVSMVGSKIWTIFGFILGTILLNGIIESIFQFDIRGMLSHKRQMIFSFIFCVVFACVFWFDLVKYDASLPKLEEIESIGIDVSGTDYYYYTNESIQADGICGEYLDEAYELAERIVRQEATASTTNVRHVTFSYHLKNGKTQMRSYYMDLDKNRDRFDNIYATEEYKDDYYPLYTLNRKDIYYITWSDYAEDIQLEMSSQEMDLLLDTYLSELSALTYTEYRQSTELGSIQTFFEAEKNDYSRSDNYPIYPQFTQTIGLLDKIIQNNETTNTYGSVTESILERYGIQYMDIYTPKQTTTITNDNQLNILKEHIILGDNGGKYIPEIDFDKYYELSIALETHVGVSQVYGFVPIEIVDSIIK